VNIFFFESENNKKQYSLLSLGFIIRQIENDLADWPKDFGEVETPLLIKYVKNDVKGRKSGDKFSEYKKNPKNEESTVFFIVLAFKEKNVI
jgi:3-hydroxyacyl-CoA dehydrogenase